MSTMKVLPSDSSKAVLEWISHKDLQKEQRDLNWQVAHWVLCEHWEKERQKGPPICPEDPA